jgi:hypothetical protein
MVLGTRGSCSVDCVAAVSDMCQFRPAAAATATNLNKSVDRHLQAVGSVHLA